MHRPMFKVDPKLATRTIIQSVRRADADLREAHAWLGKSNQNTVGVATFAGAWLLMLTVGILWLTGVLSGWVVVPVVAVGLSLLHELEHDLIHDLYFADRPRIQDLLFTGIWLGKMSLNPWSRRRLHRYHHRVSGQPEDIEERLIGLGLPWGLRRLTLSLLPAGSLLVVPAITRSVKAAVKAGAPRPDLVHAPAFAMLRAIDGVFLLLPAVVLPAAILGNSLAIELAVLWVLPNTIRHFSIVVVSSNSHYTDIPRSTLFHQNQVLDHWLTWPLQLFCFNFGATHIIHHYVVKQPFYLRQLVWLRVRDVVRDQGVPFNDLGTFARANRRRADEPIQALHPTVATTCRDDWCRIPRDGGEGTG